MLYPILFLLLFFCTTIYSRSQAIGLNPFAWVFYTILSFCLGTFIACFVLGIIIMVKNPSLFTLAQKNDRESMNSFMIQNFAENDFLYSSLIMAGAFGGYLLIRYILDKKSNK